MDNVRYTDRLNNGDIHIGAELQPLNVTFHTQAQKIWNKVDEIYQKTWQTGFTIQREHQHQEHLLIRIIIDDKIKIVSKKERNHH